MAKTKKKTRKSIPGVSRIDQPEKHNHGFYVRLTRNGKKFAKFFSDKKSGSKSKALIVAKAHYAELCAKNPAKAKRKVAAVKPRPSKPVKGKSNKSAKSKK
jgi:hypothetical protein